MRNAQARVKKKSMTVTMGKQEYDSFAKWEYTHCYITAW